MEREILFIGKRVDNGEWVEGDILKSDEQCFIVPRMGIVCIEDYEHADTNKFIQLYAYEVDPETCQYTGTPDKNDKKIFEGDIVKRELFGGNFIVGQVVWLDIGYCGFYLKHENRYYPMGKDEHTGISSCDEVIGNIFDNPELLKGDSE